MNDHYLTIGLAGHIDHGKTALTKALTGIETDRLKEEKERQISIENGYAFFDIDEYRRAAVIDVPGHEKFIRQMISGVAGIDLVLVVIAADEGVMPQTEEHLTILRFLNIKQAMIVLTKCSLVDADWLALVKEEASEVLRSHGFGHAPLFEVDSITKAGIEELKQAIIERADLIPAKNANEPFRLPIDDVFTLRGQGTIVRGTIFNGTVRESDELVLLPSEKPVRIRQMQVHHDPKKIAYASQRVALNLHGITRRDIKRGDVLVEKESYVPTERIDVCLQTTNGLRHVIRQRTPIMVHLGTAAVMGKIIFFDRNEWKENEILYGQIEFNEPVVTRRGDRVVIRRPSPVETVGGGWVIEAHAKRHRFGKKTVMLLEQSAQGTPSERMMKVIKEKGVIDHQTWITESGFSKEEFLEHLTELKDQGQVIALEKGYYTDSQAYKKAQADLLNALDHYHQDHPLRYGISKAEWLHASPIHPMVVRRAAQFLESHEKVEIRGPEVKRADFHSHYPERWKKRMETIVSTLSEQGVEVDKWETLCRAQQLRDEDIADFKACLIREQKALEMGNDFLITTDNFESSIAKLKTETKGNFTIPEAKAILGYSRKYMVPFLELSDIQGYTKRREDTRVWVR